MRDIHLLFGMRVDFVNVRPDIPNDHVIWCRIHQGGAESIGVCRCVCERVQCRASVFHSYLCRTMLFSAATIPCHTSHSLFQKIITCRMFRYEAKSAPPALLIGRFRRFVKKLQGKNLGEYTPVVCHLPDNSALLTTISGLVCLTQATVVCLTVHI